MTLPTLTLGDFDLTDWSGSNFGVSVIAEGTSRGAPVPIEVAVKSWLQDGSVVFTQGYDNRTVSLRVRLRGPDLAAVAEAEAALFAELGKPNLLTWDAGDGYSVPSVFVVVTSSMEHSPSQDEDLAERIAFPWRTYNLRLLCEAFVRSVDEVVAPALAASGTTTTLVDNGSSATGWTGTINGASSAIGVSTSAVGFTSAALDGLVTMALTRTGSITTSSTKYLMVDWRGQADAPLTATGDGVALERISQTNSPVAGYTRTWFYVAASSVTTLVLTQASYWPLGQLARPLFVDNINRTDVRPSLGSSRQLLRTISVTGSARTPGRLAIEHESAALGTVLAYTWSGGAEGYSPPLRPYRVSGGAVTTDATKLSGAYEPIKSTTITFDVPISKVSPGLHLLMLALVTASVTSGSTTTVTWTSQARLNSSNLGPAQTGTTTIPPGSIGPTGAAFAVVARLTLPTVAADPNSGAVQRITLTATTTLADLKLDDGWLFHQDGQLTSAYVGSGTPVLGVDCNRLWIEPPTVLRPRPTVRVGFNPDRSDAHDPYPGNLFCWQPPQFNPGTVNLFTVTSGTTDADASLCYFPTWHSHAAS
jgi:hypothetical protein